MPPGLRSVNRLRQVAGARTMTPRPRPKLDEGQAVEQVTVRLSARFPNLPTALVISAVRAEHAKLNGRVRDYVPVLVERAARQRLGMIATVDE
jgi:hypothetical protein